MDEAPPYAAQSGISLAEPPSYSRAPESIHSYSLEIEGRKLLTLFVNGRTPRSVSPIPIFREGQPISGRIELDLKSPEVVKGVNIEVQGGMTLPGEDEVQFLELKQRLSVPTNASSNNANKKLSGKHSWAFDIQLPREVPVSWGAKTKGKATGREGKTYRLPPSFSERSGLVFVSYRLVATVKRGTFKVNRVYVRSASLAEK
ncbi:hypothetical protein H0H81_009521 [Sphagnurus paluster]|uniref:Arrestin-like N-terminal domain-containing protein n=1 Tax=Sphagnurus paluster TaxID=117069 RepID=A0A9P7FRK2_9AGAR|nr:hypothetical protein H0H81_009521 [Sphagnurus paluster]